MFKKIKVEAGINPLRLDLYLKEKLKNYSRTKISQYIKEGLILVNNKKVKPKLLLKGGEEITIKTFTKRKNILIPLNIQPEPEILYEDEDFLIIDKPALVNVHPNLNNINQPTIASWLIFKRPQLKNVGEDPLRPGIVHRLDKDTSGILVIAKNQESFNYLKEKFKNREIYKEYLALVWGKIPYLKGEIDFSLARSKKSPFRQKAVVSQEKKSKKTRSAITFYEVLKRFKNFTLLKVIPKTGRTHQIRVHLASIGFPVVGDKEYGKQKNKKIILNRHFLHASYLEFISKSGKIIKLYSNLTKELQEFLKNLV